MKIVREFVDQEKLVREAAQGDFTECDGQPTAEYIHQIEREILIFQRCPFQVAKYDRIEFSYGGREVSIRPSYAYYPLPDELFEDREFHDATYPLPANYFKIFEGYSQFFESYVGSDEEGKPVPVINSRGEAVFFGLTELDVIVDNQILKTVYHDLKWDTHFYTDFVEPDYRGHVSKKQELQLDKKVEEIWRGLAAVGAALKKCEFGSADEEIAINTTIKMIDLNEEVERLVSGRRPRRRK